MKKSHLQETELDKQIRIKEEADAKATLEIRKSDLTHRTRYNEEAIAKRNVDILANMDEPDVMGCLVKLETTSDGFNELHYQAGRITNLQYCNDERLKNSREMNNTIRELTIALRKEKTDHKETDAEQIQYYRERCIAHDEIGRQDETIRNLKGKLHDLNEKCDQYLQAIHRTAPVLKATTGNVTGLRT